MSLVAASRSALLIIVLAALVVAFSAMLAVADRRVAGHYSGGLQVAGHYSGGVAHEGGGAG